MKKIVAWVPDNKRIELLEANKGYSIPILFVDSLKELEDNLDGFAIYYPPLVVNDKNFITLIKKYPAGTFNAICDMMAFSVDADMMGIEYEALLPIPQVAETLLETFLKIR